MKKRKLNKSQSANNATNIMDNALSIVFSRDRAKMNQYIKSNSKLLLPCFFCLEQLSNNTLTCVNCRTEFWMCIECRVEGRQLLFVGSICVFCAGEVLLDVYDILNNSFSHFPRQKYPKINDRRFGCESNDLLILREDIRRFKIGEILLCSLPPPTSLPPPISWIICEYCI